MSDETLQIETPVSLLPDLTELGIIEVDNGVCEDTSGNRNILRANKIKWQAVYGSDGSPTDLIQAISPETEALTIQKKAELLSDSRNINSDYLTGWDLVLNDEALEYVPAWVVAATRKWNKIEEEREDTGEKKQPHLREAPGRCIAKKSNGNRCQNWHNGMDTSGQLCKMHMTRTDSRAQVLLKARNRIHSLALDAVEELENSLHATSEPVRLKAATEILDRTGIRAGFEIEEKVEVTVKPAATMVADRLKKLRAVAQASESADDDIVDAVVIQEEEANDE